MGTFSEYTIVELTSGCISLPFEAGGAEGTAIVSLYSTTSGGLSTIEGCTADPLVDLGGVGIYEDSSGNLYTADKNKYEVIEKRAQEIYDKYDKNHVINKCPPVIIADTEEKAKLLNELLASGTKEELYIKLTALQMVVQELIDEEEQEKESHKIRKLEKRD